MRSAYISRLIRTPLFGAGILLQCFSAALMGVILLAIRLGWINIISLGLETPLDEQSPKLEALYWGFRFLFFAFASGFTLCALASYRLRNAQPGAAPNGGSATQLGNARVSEGPPSVS
jgi:hypothetical protein